MISFTRFLLLTAVMSPLVTFGDAINWPKLSADEQTAYDDIFEPMVVATPPAEAGPNSMRVMRNGKIRVQGQRKYGGKVRQVVMESADLGMNWTMKIQHHDFMGEQCPWDDYRAAANGPASNRADFGWCSVERGTKVERFKAPGLVSYGRLRAFPQHKRWYYTFCGIRWYGDRMYTLYPSCMYSDDDCKTWSKPFQIEDIEKAEPEPGVDLSPVWWSAGCCEPDQIELKNGEALMVTRTGGDHAWWYRSQDGGKTWGKHFVMPAFWMSNTMPLLLRLKDGRIMFFWNNTQYLPRDPLENYPELNHREKLGLGEIAFTNRDALHAAISEDDGETWIGFREIALSDIRNREDYREYLTDFWQGCDKSIHQAAAVELPGGKIAVMYGQNRSSRRIALFDVKWLYEKSRKEDLRTGLGNISNHLFLKSLMGSRRGCKESPEGWSGHCSINRIPGATMAREPDTDAKTFREALRICRIRDERLMCERQGVVWNFPAVKRGEVKFTCRVEGEGVRVSLCDHWINPSDRAIEKRSMASLPMTAAVIGGAKKWVDVTVRWDLERGEAVLEGGGAVTKFPIRREGFSPFGISYLHLQSLAEQHDPEGTYFRGFDMRGE